MGGKREFKESPLEMGEDEIIAFDLDVSNWPATGGAISGISVVLKDPDGNDVSSTNLTGSASSPSTDVVRTPQLTSLVAGLRYRLEIQWVQGGDTWEGWGWVDATE